MCKPLFEGPDERFLINQSRPHRALTGRRGGAPGAGRQAGHGVGAHVTLDPRAVPGHLRQRRVEENKQ